MSECSSSMVDSHPMSYTLLNPGQKDFLERSCNLIKPMFMGLLLGEETFTLQLHERHVQKEHGRLPFALGL